MSSTLMRYYIARYVCAYYPGRIFRKLKVFNDKIIESSFIKYFVKEMRFALLLRHDRRCNKK